MCLCVNTYFLFTFTFISLLSKSILWFLYFLCLTFILNHKKPLSFFSPVHHVLTYYLFSPASFTYLVCYPLSFLPNYRYHSHPNPWKKKWVQERHLTHNPSVCIPYLYPNMVAVMPISIDSADLKVASYTAAPTKPQLAIGPQKCVVFQPWCGCDKLARTPRNKDAIIDNLSVKKAWKKSPLLFF